jgi:ABC-type glycerol-3-phosphate transport system substrate-binding protein
MQPISRRNFLKSAAGAAGVVAAGGLLNGCTVPVAAPGGAAPVAAATTDVYTMTFGAFADMGQRDATALFNDQVRDSGYRVVLEEVVENAWEPKAISMVKENDMRWSASGIANAGNQWNYLQMGIVQPLDDLLATSTVPWAQSVQEQYVAPNIYEATIYDGKVSYIPMKLNIHLMGYRQDYLQRAGYDEIPATWDEFEVMLGELKSALEPEGIVPFAVRKEVFRTLGTAFTTFVENPYNEDNMLRIDSEEWLACIAMFKRWFDAGYTNLQLLQDPMPDWQKGKVAIGIDSHSWIRIGRSIWGSENVKGTVPPQVDANQPKRTWAHLDSGFVFTGAPNAQEGLDWLLSVLGPEGAPADRYWAGTLTFSGMPVHKGQYERLIAGNANFPELVSAYEALPNSTLQPMAAGRYYPIIQAKIWPWLERYWGNEISGEEAMQNTMDEVQAELAKQVS